MEEISLHILDIAYNSIAADAKLVTINVHIDTFTDHLQIEIKDDGCGIPKDDIDKCLNTHYSTKGESQHGRGLPLFRKSTQLCEGDATVVSEENQGTTVTGCYKLSHQERKPLGNIGETFATLIQAGKSCEFSLNYIVDNRGFHFETTKIREILDKVPLDTPNMSYFIKDYIQEQILLCGGQYF